MKQVNLILQSKGGVGKSLFMWFVAQKQKAEKTVFIDLDESTQTSATRLGAVVGKERVRSFKILNEYKKLEREKIISLFEGLATAKSDTFYIDFGAPESAEFLHLLENDVPADILREELVALGINLRVFVIVAGRDALNSCVNYYNAILKALDTQFPLSMVVNMGTFGGIETAEKAIEKLIELGFAPIKRFGDLGSGGALKEIIDLIGQPDPDPATLGMMSRIMYRKKQDEIKEIIA
jgi:MinD-like ATPase involved in chromosome partitioning or flagellar assembly